ncbi:MAG: hypothetical protein M3014_07260, partial [Chloroflexota bacterium]|nr:hypothetical protein [Chloroflexota bacterium]
MALMSRKNLFFFFVIAAGALLLLATGVAAARPASPAASASLVGALISQPVCDLPAAPAAATRHAPLFTPSPLPTSSPTNTPVCGLVWRGVASPDIANGGNLLAVQVISSNNVWAAGYSYNTGNESAHTLVEHWDGAAWSVVPSPNVGTAGSGLAALAVVAPDDIWAAGFAGGYTTYIPLTMHWDGMAWNIVAAPTIPGNSTQLFGLAAVSHSDVWAAGAGGNDTNAQYQTLLEHWDGAAWSIVQSPNPGPASNRLKAISAVSVGDIWAVGSRYDDNSGRVQSLTLHWDGTAWSNVPSAPSAGYNALNGVSAYASDDVWAVGEGPYPDKLLEHWDGTAWSISTPPHAGDNRLYGVTMLAPDDVWAVGYSGGVGGSQAIHWDGTSWQAPANLTGVYLLAVSAASHTDVWAVGFPGGSQPAIERYNDPCVTPTATGTVTGTPPTATNTPPNSTPTATRPGGPTSTASRTATAMPTTTCCNPGGNVTTGCSGPNVYPYDLALSSNTPNCAISLSGPVDLYYQVSSGPDPGGSWSTIDHQYAGNFTITPGQTIHVAGTFQEATIPSGSNYYRVHWTMGYINCQGGRTADGYSDPAPLCPAPTPQPATPTSTGTATMAVSPTMCPVQFTDVPVTNTFYPYVRCLACRGIVTGYQCGGSNPLTGQQEPCDAQYNPFFRYNNPITRGQIGKLVSNSAGFSDDPGAQLFEDIPVGSPF